MSKSPGHYPDVLQAIADESNKLGMFTMVDLKVSQSDGAVASDAGVRSIEHWYGIPDAALVGSQNFPTDYNYWDELDRFRYAGLLWCGGSSRSGVGVIADYQTAHWDPTSRCTRTTGLGGRRNATSQPDASSEVAAGPDTSVHGA